MTRKRQPLVTLIHRKFLARMQDLPRDERFLIMTQYSMAMCEASLQWAQELREEKSGVKEDYRDSEYTKDNWPEDKR